MFKKKKYRLLPKEAVVTPDGEIHEVRRVQALIDIPLHNVKAGDIGGYVSTRKNLSHEGSSWVGGNAIVLNKEDIKTIVIDDALVTDDAVVYGAYADDVRITGKAQLIGNFEGSCNIGGNVYIKHGKFDGNITMKDNVHIVQAYMAALRDSMIVISGEVFIDCPLLDKKTLVDWQEREYGVYLKGKEIVAISGGVSLENSSIRGNCKLDGNFQLDNATFKGDNTILGTPDIKPEVKFSGINKITGDSMIPPGSRVHDVVMDTGILDYSAGRIALLNTATPASSSRNQEKTRYIAAVAQIEAEYEAYTTDIVKLIKYPGMVDASIPEVGDFLLKLRSAKRAVDSFVEENLAEMAESLERAFVLAENKVQTLVASHLDEGKKKSLKTAEKMFALACDEASPEPEKRLGFKAGMRALEGIIPVSNSAVEQMKARVGILELEA